MAELYPNGTAVARSHTVLVMTLALLLAALIGAGLMFVGWAVFGDDDAVVVPNASAPATTAPHVTTAAEIASARALDRVKNEAATAAAIGNSPGITKERAAAPTSSLSGTTAKEAKTDAKVHAEAMHGIAAARERGATAGTPAKGAAAVEAGTAVKGDDDCLDAVVGHC
jgi:multidrug efflux pump subunit AcrB